MVRWRGRSWAAMLVLLRRPFFIARAQSKAVLVVGSRRPEDGWRCFLVGEEAAAIFSGVAGQLMCQMGGEAAPAGAQHHGDAQQGVAQAREGSEAACDGEAVASVCRRLAPALRNADRGELVREWVKDAVGSRAPFYMQREGFSGAGAACQPSMVR